MLRADRDADSARHADANRGAFQRWVAGLPIDARATVGAALRAGAAAVAIILAVSAVALTALLVLGYADIIRLYEALHTEVVGGVAVTALQLALLPDLVVWTASWFVGPGFAIGTGSQVSPLGTSLGPLPALPVFGALPTGGPRLRVRRPARPGRRRVPRAGSRSGRRSSRALDGVRLPAVAHRRRRRRRRRGRAARPARLGVIGQRRAGTAGRRRPVAGRRSRSSRSSSSPPRSRSAWPREPCSRAESGSDRAR